LYIHSTGWCIFSIVLSNPLTIDCPVSLPPSHQSTNLVYDSVSGSVLLINDLSTTMRTITQFKKGSSFNFQYSINSTNFLLGNSKTFISAMCKILYNSCPIPALEHTNQLLCFVQAILQYNVQTLSIRVFAQAV